MTTEAVNRGRFQKGSDPRRSLTGGKTVEAHSFGRLFVNALATKGDPAKLAEVLWEKAMKGQPWAVEMVLDRLLGKVSQPIEGAHEVIYKVIYDKAAARKG